MSEGQYTSELRFGVVMYGGVSLAIYINGVANELFEACCATPKDGSVAAGGGSRVVYRKLSWLLANPGLRALARLHAQGRGDDPFDAEGRPRDPAFASDRQRFVVDVIAGTSAGGINGVFLAKALANGQPFAPLQQLWVDEGDIGLLLNDAESVKKLPLDPPRAPNSLLNSDRMYLKLLAAMQDMEAAPPALPAAATPAARSPLADEIDLFVTTTDIEGSIVPIRLFDKLVHERRHRQVFQFRYTEPSDPAAAPSSDFRNQDSPFLAFAARCTSSFPFAFEPMTLQDAARVCAKLGQAQDFADRKRFFSGLGEADLAGDGWMRRPFGDGGYLDNKPFSHAVEALSSRQEALPVERKLVYVEPAPVDPRQQRKAEGKPHALANALAALSSIPQYETIREDLQAVLKRNRRIERVERMVRMVEQDIEMQADDPFARILLRDNQVPNWAELDLTRMLEYYGVSFLPYRRLRLNTVSDELARQLGRRWDVDPDSDLQYALRALVRAWREERYYDHARERTATQTASVNAFLSDFDRSYRRRRAAFLLRKTKQLQRLLPRLRGLDEGVETAGEGEEALLKRLRRHAGGALQALDLVRLQQALQQLRQGLAQVLHGLRDGGAVSPAPEAQRKQLAALLGLLLGQAGIDSLPGVNGQVVPIRVADLPPPSPSRTLQQNVFDRAQMLFRLARAGQRTELQEQLEADLEGLRLEGEQADHPHARALRLLRDLLGRPTLAPELEYLDQPDGSRKEISRIAVVVDPVAASLPGAELLNSREGETLRKLLAEYRSRFDEFDQVAFPLYYDTGTGEPSTVEVVRVSPEDAPSLVKDRPAAEQRKLAGTALFNFGGFLDANWRRNDILWGRLDGAERLLAALLPGEEDALLRQQLREEAHRAILRESMSQQDHDELVQRFTAALRESGQPTLQQAFGKVWAALGPDDGARHDRVEQALRAVLNDAGLLSWAREAFRPAPEPSGPMLETAARAVTITGRVLQGIEQEQRLKAQRAVWLTRAGLALQALLTLSLPGSLASSVMRHWVHRVYAFAALLFAGGLVLSSPTARNFGLGVFVVVAVADLLLRIAGDAQHRRWGWLKFALGGGLLAILGLAAVGAFALVRQGLSLFF